MNREIAGEHGIIRFDGEGWEVEYFRPVGDEPLPGMSHIVGLAPYVELEPDCSDSEALIALEATLAWEGVLDG